MSTPTQFPINLRSPTVRAVAIGALILLLQIPLLLVSSLADERRLLRDEVAHEIGEKWGRHQTLVGPWIEVPYVVPIDDEQFETRTHRFLPQEFEAKGELDVELRARGIFSVPVYLTNLSVTGTFEVPQIEDAHTVYWDRARVVIQIDDPSAIHGVSGLRWDDTSVEFEPGQQTLGLVAATPLAPPGTVHSFSFDVSLAGTGGFYVVPVGERSTVELGSSWLHPSFQGNWLPDHHQIDTSGFAAIWSVSSLSRGFPTQWSGDTRDMEPRLRSAAVGVELTSAVDHYVMSARSTRYAILFFVAVFGVLWVLEMRGQFRLHPIHYLLAGAALCSFHLLILAFAEHLGFAVAYGLAAGMVTLLLIYYAHGALRNPMAAASVGATCMAVYGYLYVCLADEDHALLFGAIGVFAGIAAVMVMTRRLAWVRPDLDDGIVAELGQS